MKKQYCIGLLAVASEAALIWYQGRRRGATDQEVNAPLPGDDIVPHPMLETTHAISIHASAADIWPWLVQMGDDRAGRYTAPSGRDGWINPLLRALLSREERARAPRLPAPGADHIVPDLQGLHVGDALRQGPPGTAFFTVKGLERNHFLALYSNTHARYLLPAPLRHNPTVGVSGEFSRTFILHERTDGSTRLILRTRASYGPRLFRILTLLPVLTMEVFTPFKMLSSIKERAESQRHLATTAGAPGHPSLHARPGAAASPGEAPAR